MNDVSLIVRDKILRCNRKSLAAASPYFEAMFTKGFIESNATSININDVDPDVMNFLVRFSGTSSMPANDLDYFDVLRAARLFQFEEICQRLVEHFITILEVKNCFRIWEVADFLELQELRKEAKRIALWDTYWLEGNEIGTQTLPYHVFLELVSDSRLRVKSESRVLSSVELWLTNNGTIEQELAINLLKNVRFRQCDRNKLKNNSCLREWKEIFQIVESILECDNTPINELSLNDTQTPRKLPLIALVVEIRQDKPVPMAVLQTCVLTTEGFKLETISTFSFRQFQSELKYLVGFGVSVADASVYLFGGKEHIASGSWNEELWKFDTFKRVWKPLSPMPKKIRHFLYAANSEFIYVMGGFGMYRISHGSVLRYCIETDCWSELSDAPGPIFSACVSCYKGVLYFFSDGVYRLHVEPDGTSFWERRSHKVPLDGATQAVAHEDFIYLFSPNSSNMAIYDPEENRITRKVSLEGANWQHCCIFDREIWLFYDGGVEILHLEGWTKRAWRKLELSSIENVALIPVYN